MWELRRQLEYKAKWYGSEIILADRFYPSSQICHVCQFQNKCLELKDREWACEICQAHHDRDVNAACNLKALCEERNLKCSSTASSAGFQACGEESADVGGNTGVKLALGSRNSTLD